MQRFYQLCMLGGGGESEVKYCDMWIAFARFGSKISAVVLLQPSRIVARLDASGRGAICALLVVGAKREDIAKKVRKKDGKRSNLRTVDVALAKRKEDLTWRGEDSRTRSRPQVVNHE